MEKKTVSVGSERKKVELTAILTLLIGESEQNPHVKLYDHRETTVKKTHQIRFIFVASYPQNKVHHYVSVPLGIFWYMMQQDCSG